MQLTVTTFLITCPLVFFAGFVDSVAGGGGLISLPAYLFAGVPIHLAYGTNKFANAIGSMMATLQFAKSKKIRYHAAGCAAAAALAGAWAGARLALHLSAETLQVTMMIALPCAAVFVLTRKSLGSDQGNIVTPLWRECSRAAVIGLLCGAYDGLFGPGTGTFLIIGFTALLGYSMVFASGNAKVVNVASNVGALVAYLLAGKVLFALAVPCMLCSVAGNLLGARMAIKRGAKFIRPVMLFVLGALLGKIALDFFF